MRGRALDRFLSKAHLSLKVSSIYFLLVVLTGLATAYHRRPEGAPWGFFSPAEQVASTPTNLPSSVETPTPSPAPTSTPRPSPTFAPTPTLLGLAFPVLNPFPYMQPSLEAASTATPSPTPTARPTLAPSPTPSPTPPPTPPPAPTPDGISRRATVPILMYHHIAVPPPEADAVRRDLSVPPLAFEAQLRYLVDNGYHAIRLRDLIRHLALGEPLPSKPIILTFDDGYQDSYTSAFPLLKKYGSAGSFFIITDFVGREGYLTWEEIAEMHRAGMEIGSHSRDHPDLKGKPLDYIIWQVLGSKEALEARLGEPVRFFSYPSGQHDERVRTILRQAHFWGAVTTEQGVIHSSADTFRFGRLRVRGSEGVKELAAKLEQWTGQGAQ